MTGEGADIHDEIEQPGYPGLDLYRVAEIRQGWVQDRKNDITGTMPHRHHTE